jgi:hypothetical protein
MPLLDISEKEQRGLSKTKELSFVAEQQEFPLDSDSPSPPEECG